MVIATVTRPLCGHCHKSPVQRPRGLCWTCYYSPIREQYTSGSVFAHRGVGNFTRDATLPEPTTALPGTPEKVAILEARAQAGEQLFHPADPVVTL